MKELKSLGHDAALAGEMVAVDERGHVLFLDGDDLCGRLLEERKAILAEILPELPRVKLCEYIETNGREFYRQAAWRAG